MGPFKGLVGILLIGNVFGAKIKGPSEIIQNERAAAAFSDDSYDASEKVSANDREEKFLSVFQIVKFKNDACSADDGNTGVCFTEAECSAKGGVASGSCASAFGVCCVFTVKICSDTVTQNNTYIESPNYPAPAPTGMCSYTLNKCDSNICQFRLEFEDVVVSDPAMGDCTNDTIMVSGVDASSMKVVPMSLCGTLTGQHMVVSVKDATEGAKLIFNIVSGTSMAKWRVKVIQLSCADNDLLAPAGCLTYGTAESGTIQSFNYNGGNGEQINNQKFSHCIKYQDGFCDVALTSTTFDLGASGDAGDSLVFGNSVQSGNMFGSSGSLIWNFTGPYLVQHCSDDMNTDMNAGYSISYLLLPC